MEKHIVSKHGNSVTCVECGNIFPDIKTCEDHMASKHVTPPPPEPFPCEFCGLVLANFHTLQRHVLTHHTENNGTPELFSCKVCHSTLPDLPALEKHQQVHYSTQTFACIICDFSTSMYTELMRHKLTHDEDLMRSNDPAHQLINVLIAQQGSILEQVTNSEKRWERQLNDLKSNQDNILDQIKLLKQSVLDSKQETSDVVSSKVDKLIKLVESVKDFKTNQPSQTSQEMKKKKVLFVGDSLSRKLNLSVVKNVTDTDIKRVEAFIVGKDDPKARVPSKNFTDIVPKELKNENVSTLILQGGTNEVSNLDVTGDIGVKMEAMKEEIKISSEKLFILAEESLKNNEGLEKVIILKRVFRCDPVKNDPSQIRDKMSEYGNRVLEDMWLAKGCPKNIVIASQPLECDGPLRISRYGYPSSREYDGIHMRGKMAVQHYTGSVINVLMDNLCGFEASPRIPLNKPQHSTYANVVKNGQNKTTFQPSTQAGFNGNFKKTTGLNSDTGYTRQSTTGTNETPLGGGYFYNVKTQNRFTHSASGN
jgi:hypothetical protein